VTSPKLNYLIIGGAMLVYLAVIISAIPNETLPKHMIGVLCNVSYKRHDRKRHGYIYTCNDYYHSLGIIYIYCWCYLMLCCCIS